MMNRLREMPALTDEGMVALKEREAHHEGGITGIPSKLTELDHLTFGWQKGELIVVGGRPSMGKTAVMLKLVLEAAKAGYPTFICSLEMSGLQLTNRMILGHCQMDVTRFKLGTLLPEERLQVENARQYLATLPIHVIDNGIHTVDEW